MLTQNDKIDFGKILPKVPVFKFETAQDDIDKAIQAFLTGKVGKFGKYIAAPNALVYRTILTSRNGTKQEIGQNIIALKLERKNETLFVGNSSILPLVGRTVAWGDESLNRGVTDVQTRLSRYIQMIPFSVFTEANLDLTEIEILDRGPESTVIRAEKRYNPDTREDETRDVEVHFTGASLFTVGGKLFLFDIDRREIEHKIFNAFLVELKINALTIQGAYDSLKPAEVVEAERKGLKVKRQGEWFFIPVQGEYEGVTRTNFEGKTVLTPMTLQAGRNRPNTVTKHSHDKQGEVVVTGKVEHSGREHAALILKGWYKPVVNTSVQSFTLRGDVD